LKDAVAEKLKAFTPDKVEQFELLIRDSRSMRRLADQTLNNESVVTGENAGELLEAMRQATIEEEKKAFEGRLADEKAKATARLTAGRGELKQVRAERDEARLTLQASREADLKRLGSVAQRTSMIVRRIDRFLTAAVFILAAVGVVNYFTGWFTQFRVWSLIIAALLGAFGLYHQVMNALEHPKVGVRTLMKKLAQYEFLRRVRNAGLDGKFDLSGVDFEQGRVQLPSDLMTPLA
jgi:cation transport ATPase